MMYVKAAGLVDFFAGVVGLSKAFGLGKRSRDTAQSSWPYGVLIRVYEVP